MKRRKIKKVRTTISIDEDIFIESGDYIYNLSAFVQECMRREIAKQKQAKNRDALRISANMETQKNPSHEPTYDELIEMLENF